MVDDLGLDSSIESRRLHKDLQQQQQLQSEQEQKSISNLEYIIHHRISADTKQESTRGKGKYSK